MYFLDTDHPEFPDPRKYDPPGGLIAAGGNLGADVLLEAYNKGIFPWYNPGEEILWWSPDPRFVLFPEDLKISKSMRKILTRNKFNITENQCFAEVMRRCALKERRDQDGTWISEELIESFTELHRRGLAHSVEVWKEGQLVGGLYGLLINRVFCGESMFSEVSNASKAGFITFILRHRHDFDLVDCQIHSEHLESLGARFVPKSYFLDVLQNKNGR